MWTGARTRGDKNGLLHFQAKEGLQRTFHELITGFGYKLKGKLTPFKKTNVDRIHPIIPLIKSESQLLS